MTHDRVDLEPWKAAFSMARLRQEARERVLARWARVPERERDEAAIRRQIRSYEPGGARIFTPAEIAIVEQLREEVFGPDPLIKRVPTDVFVFRLGEPPRRDVTKVGGVPYLPLSRAWPRNLVGEPF